MNEMDILRALQNLTEDVEAHGYTVDIRDNGIWLVPPYYSDPPVGYAYPRQESPFTSVADADAWWWEEAQPQVDAIEDEEWSL